MSEPRTETGRQLQESEHLPHTFGLTREILAIEAEARATLLADLREKVEALRDDNRTAVGEPDPARDDGAWHYAQWLREDAVLALLES